MTEYTYELIVPSQYFFGLFADIEGCSGCALSIVLLKCSEYFVFCAA